MKDALALLGDSESYAVQRATARASLGNLYGKLGHLELAKAHFQSALLVFDRFAWTGDAAGVRLNLAHVEMWQGRPGFALEQFEKIRLFAEEAGLAQMRAQALLGKAEVVLRVGRPRDALAWAAEACAGVAQGVRIRAECERDQGRAHRTLSNLEAANDSYLRAIDALEEMHGAIGDPTEIGGEALYRSSREVFREAIDLLLQLHAAHPGRGYDRSAFGLSERAKSRVFQEQLRRTGIRWRAAPDSVFASSACPGARGIGRGRGVWSPVAARPSRRRCCTGAGACGASLAGDSASTANARAATQELSNLSRNRAARPGGSRPSSGGPCTGRGRAFYAGITEPSLALTQVSNPSGQDGFLTMSEVIGLDLRAELTVLSACNTAGEPTQAQDHGEGFAGLVRSFMYAGSRAVLATHWSVFETTARDFVVEFFKRAPAQGADRALTKATRHRRGASAVADESGRSRISLAHPTFWAGFVLVGD